MTAAESRMGTGSVTGPGSAAGEGTAPAREQELTAEIERTRKDLGATVEALAAKTDFKARFRAALRRLVLPLRPENAKAKAASQVSSARAAVDKAVPEPVQQAARKAAVTARERRGPLAVAAGAAALASVAVGIVRWRRR